MVFHAIERNFTLYLFDDSSSCDVDLGVKHHHDDKRQVEGADGRIELHTQNSHITKTQTITQSHV
jgi:hypothetical protein